MGKTADNTLHRLVHSLNKTEIRDFRASAGRMAEELPAYLTLFDLLLQQETFDDEALFRDSGYTRKATYNETKRYLQETLLQELCAWKNKRSPEFRARNLFDQARVLAGRNLQQQALDKLQQALTLADRYEQHELAFPIIAFREDLLRDMNAIGVLLPESEPNHRRKQQYLATLRQRAELQLTYNQLFCYYREYSSRSAKQLLTVANRLGKRKNDVPKQYEEQRLYYSVLEKKAEVLHQDVQAIAIQQKMIALIEQNLHHENAHTDYAIWLHNLHANYVHTNNHEAATEVIRKMQQAATLAPARLRTGIRLIRYNAEIFFRLKQQQYAAIKKLHGAYVTDLPLTLVRNNPNAQVWLLHQFTFATAFFMTGDYKNCIRLLFVMDNQNKWEIGQKIILESFALKALAHWERDQPEQAGKMVKRYFALVQDSGNPAVSPTQLLLTALREHLRTGKPMDWKKVLAEIHTRTGGKITPDFVLYGWVRKKAGMA